MKAMSKKIICFLAILILLMSSAFSDCNSIQKRADMTLRNDSTIIDSIAKLEIEKLDYSKFEYIVNALPTYYNLAFKATVPVTCFMNSANIEDTRLLYQNWGSIYGIAPTASQVIMPQPYQSHRGQDWNSSVYQEPLYAVHNGVVTRASYDASYGNRIDYTFGNWTLYMGHMSRMDVKVGDVVTKGQKLGNVGSTGNVTGEHVHFGLLYKGKLVDPHPFLVGIWDFDAKQAELEGTATNTPGVYLNSYSVEVRIRSGPGTGYSIVGSITPGSQVVVTSFSSEGNRIWGKHSGGYSCIQEGTLKYMTLKYSAGSHRNIATQNLMIRSGPGTSHGIVGSIAPGASVSLTSFTIVNGDEVWGKHSAGWSCLELSGSVYMKRN